MFRVNFIHLIWWSHVGQGKNFLQQSPLDPKWKISTEVGLGSYKW